MQIHFLIRPLLISALCLASSGSKLITSNHARIQKVLSEAFRWRADDDPTFNAGLVAAIYQGNRTCIARKLYIFVIFQGGSDPLSPLDPHMSNPVKHALCRNAGHQEQKT